MLHHFYPTGRISRWPYFWRVPALYLVAFIYYGLPAFAEHKFNDAGEHWKNIALAGIAFCAYMVVVQGVKRLHDLNLRGWWLLLMLVPLVSIGLGSALAFVSGTAGPNRFGASPSQPATQSLALA
jgi:uncharacterized membrane protein YhaH (DUF805 family)